MSDQAREPLPEQRVEVPDYRGVPAGELPRFRDAKNARRQIGSSINSHIDKDAPWGSD